MHINYNRKVGITMPDNNDYILLNIEKREWASKTTGNSGSTYCFNNSKTDVVDCFGHEASLSISKPGEQFSSGQPKVFLWLNKMTDTMYQAFLEEYGDSIYIHIPTKKLITIAEFKVLGLDTSDTASQPSVAPSF